MVIAQGAASPRTLSQGDHTQIMSAREVVVRTPADWDALWRAHVPTPPPAAPDFSKEMVVGVFLGTKPTPGYGVTIVSATTEAGVVRVRYREASPPADAISAQVITYPFHIVAVPKSAAVDVKFDKIK